MNDYGFSTSELTLVEQRVANDGPSTGATYLLWIFLWWVSAHRFYLRRPGSAILQIISYFFVIGFLWALIDVALIPGLVRSRRAEIRDDLMTEMRVARLERGL